MKRYTTQRLGWTDTKGEFIPLSGTNFEDMSFSEIIAFMDEVKKMYPDFDDYQIDVVEEYNWGDTYKTYFIEGITEIKEQT